MLLEVGVAWPVGPGRTRPFKGGGGGGNPGGGKPCNKPGRKNGLGPKAAAAAAA